MTGPSASSRIGVPERLIDAEDLAVSGTSSGAVSRSLTSRIEPSFTRSPSSMSCASCSAVEIRVPARNVSDQGLTTLPDAVGVSSRMIGRSSRDGVPGGSSS